MKMTNTKMFTCTLTRWHKVVERLNKEYNQLCKSAKTALTATCVSEYLGEAQEQRLIALRAQSLSQLESLFEIQEVVVRVRTALGAANEREGVSSALAQYDKLVKRAQLLSALIEPRSGNWFGIDELKNIKNPPRSMGFLEHGKTKIDVAMLDGAELARLESMRQKVTTAMYAQADAIAELNKSTLSLELPFHIAQVVGL
jgi:hypothetical protein